MKEVTKDELYSKLFNMPGVTIEVTGERWPYTTLWKKGHSILGKSVEQFETPDARYPTIEKHFLNSKPQ